MFRLLLWEKGKGNGKRSMSDVKRLGVYPEKTLIPDGEGLWKCLQGRTHLPQVEGHP